MSPYVSCTAIQTVCSDTQTTISPLKVGLWLYIAIVFVIKASWGATMYALCSTAVFGVCTGS